ncbi:trypsin-1-like [Belonocnema kinseyi]|uniref:trypsin-1-like n=1 Tax=Belonocnema kinseyi TaxID=2817044 RepID=UPI00143DE873|nr:trypsin-1-like [Belonocnema kinseyi]
MGKKSFLTLLLACAVLSHALMALSEKNIGNMFDNRKMTKEDSSDIHIRKKCLIDKMPHKHVASKIQGVPNIVEVQKNFVTACAGSILASAIILTAAHCLSAKNVGYSVLSYTPLKKFGTRHRFMKVIKHPDYRRRDFSNDLALIKILPHIDFHFHEKIDLFHGYIFPFTYGTLSGWKYIDKTPRNQKKFSIKLKSTHVPIISRVECRKAYKKIARITDKHVCTLDRTGKLGSREGDNGGPLIVKGQLLGVFSIRKGIIDGRTPDVFVNLNDPANKAWVLTTKEELLA